MGTPSRRWVALPAALLAAMACLQALRIQLQDLNSWADGPGFAMFARLDALPSRFARLHLETDRGLERVPPFEALGGALHRLRVLPSRANAEAVAEALLGRPWLRDGEALRPAPEDDAGDAPVRVRGARVELWSLDLENGALVPYRKLTVQRDVADG